MKKYKIIVPCWSELSIDMQVETGAKYPVFIRLGGVPLYLHILRLYQSIKNDAEFIFALSSEAPEIPSQHTIGYNVIIKRIEKSESIGHTVLGTLADIAPNQSVVVHMADTLIPPITDNKLDIIYVQGRSDLYRWTAVRREKTGSINVIVDRDRRTAGIKENVCVGVFIFSNGSHFYDRLVHATSYRKEEIDPLFSAVESYSKKQPIDLLEPEYWYDCGHIDSFYESRLNFNNLRHFNFLSFDPVMATVTKTSKKPESLRHQVRWFKQVPDDLSSFLPRIYESSDGDVPYLKMELLTIPTLGELYINSRLDLGAWNNVLSKIKYIHGIFEKYAIKLAISKSIAYEIYIGKTKKRIQQFIEQCPDALGIGIIFYEFRISLQYVLLTLDKYAEELQLLALDTLTPIHGDMCFSNLLYDTRGRHIKIIDPRGEFGVPGIYGDPRYDKSKLMHSYSGGYDFITSDRFSVEVTSSGILSCSIENNDYHSRVARIFDEALFSGELERRQCDAIQGLLFLSMLPLHADKPERQLAMLHQGLKIYARNLVHGKIL